MARLVPIFLLLLAAAACTSNPLGPKALTVTEVTLSASGPVSDSVAVTVRATNLSTGVVRVTNCFGLDLEVRDADGELVWRRIDGTLLALCTPGGVTIGPLEEREWSATWWLVDSQDEEVAAGQYTITPILRELTVADVREVRAEAVTVTVE